MKIEDLFTNDTTKKVVSEETSLLCDFFIENAREEDLDENQNLTPAGARSLREALTEIKLEIDIALTRLRSIR